MQPTKESKDRVISELTFALDRMRRTKDYPSKLFYFSTFFGTTSRLMNAEYDRSLTLLHLVTSSTHRSLNSFLVEGEGRTGPASLPPGTFQILEACSAEILRWFLNDEPAEKLIEPLSKLAELAFLTTGNGYWLSQRGQIKLQG